MCKIMEEIRKDATKEETIKIALKILKDNKAVKAENNL